MIAVRAPQYILGVFAWTLATVLAGTADAQTVNTLDLGTLGGTESRANDLNNRGEVVGEADLSAPPGERHAFYWRGDVGMRDLGTLGGTRSTATRINHVGQVIGTSRTGSGATHGFFWSEATGMLDLGLFIPEDLNERGQVVGNGPTSSGASHAFVWSQATGMVDLGTLGGATSSVFRASSGAAPTARRLISDAGEVIGTSLTLGGSERGFYWTPTGGMVDLDTRVGGTGNQATDIDDAGRIWGKDGPTNANWFVWTPTGGKQHVTVVTPTPPPPPGITVGFQPVSVNDTGSAVGMYFVTPNVFAGVWAVGNPARPVSSVADSVGERISDNGQVLGTNTSRFYFGFGVRSLQSSGSTERGQIFVYGVSNAGAAGDSITTGPALPRHAVYWCQPGVGPSVTAVGATPTTLTPVDGRMVTVRLDYRAWAPCGGSVTRTVSVTSNQTITGDVVVVDPNTVQLRAASTGGTGRTYAIQVRVTDAAGNATTRDVTVTVPPGGGGSGPMTGITLTASLTSPQPVGTTITLSAVGSGGTTPYAYRFWAQPWNGDWQLIRDWGPSATYAWTPTTPGGYNVWVQARSAGATNVEVQNGINFEIRGGGGGGGPMTGITLTANRTSPQPAGTTITLSATGTGGATPYAFSFWVQPWNGDWQLLRDWAASPTHAWTPTTAGGYNVWVQGRSAGGTNVDVQTGINFVITAGGGGGGGGPMTGVALTTNLASPQRPGTPITLTATGTGGTTPYSFRFWVQPWGGDWQLLLDWGTTPTHSWTPTTTGGYSVWVQGRSSGGTAVEVQTGVNFEIR